MNASWIVVGWLIGTVAVVGAAPPEVAFAAEPMQHAAQTLVGTWNGRWISADGRGHGSVELLVARTPGTDDVVGQFTFITGGVSRALRYEGRVQDGRIEFPLVGDGRIVLEPRDGARLGVAERLRGEWSDVRGALPTSEGVIALHRIR